MNTPDTPPANLAPGRTCDGCTLCCKVLNISVLQKPRQVWCQHCEIGAGCGIYEDRPAQCASFYCLYRISPELGEDWKPSLSKMVLNYESNIGRVNVAVDADYPDVWKQEPYHSQLRSMALHLLRAKRHLLVWTRGEVIAILPDRDVSFEHTPDKIIVVRGRVTARGEDYEALALDPDDPRLAAQGVS